MTTGTAAQTRWEGGRIVVDPDDLAAAYPYGGTEVGLVGQCRFRPVKQILTNTAEEFGGTVVEVAIGGDAAVMSLNARGWNKDMILNLPGGSAGPGSTGRLRGDVSTSGVRSGVFLTGVKVLHVPDDRTNGIFTLLRSAVVHVDATAAAEKSYSREFGTPVVLMATPPSGGIAWEQGKKGELTL